MLPRRLGMVLAEPYRRAAARAKSAKYSGLAGRHLSVLGGQLDGRAHPGVYPRPPRTLRPRARASRTTRSVASHQKLVGPPAWIEFQSMSISNQRAPLSATAWSIRWRTGADSQRMAEPALMPARSLSIEPGADAWTPGV